MAPEGQQQAAGYDGNGQFSFGRNRYVFPEISATRHQIFSRFDSRFVKWILMLIGQKNRNAKKYQLEINLSLKFHRPISFNAYVL